ncbi:MULTISPECIES: disulfide bond formation protein B [Thiorhodovibrio]|uniref:disulfide bond formation protein B n=1 Tax=Thiorhodovibrio TaxID=61593 RepID=UPI00191442D1|nr:MULTISPECIES: disulfide bond formation protein B [Thiorhodovibrio]MBK5970531.1 disulfide bond formation protein B [Thiorhodovibrio winogradskyi]WPL14754.1 Disulfide oxidoreductase [Thiorhodovibrio litoralis]
MNFSRSNWHWLALALVCGVAAVTSIVLTAWLQLDPCHLCIFQRLLFLLMTPLALLALLRAPWGALAGGAFASLALTGAMVATYQTWLQLQPPGSISCMGAEMGPIERLVEWLGSLWPALFMAGGFCEDRELVILGLSLANWALVLYLGVLALALWCLISRRSRR